MIEFLLLSEDSSKCWPTVQQHVVRRLLRSIDREADLTHVSFTPMSDGEASQAMRANRWRTRAGRRDAVDERNLLMLVRSIATHVAYSYKFCSFHYDGDTTWGARDSSNSDAVFSDGIRDRVRAQLALQRFPDNLTDEQRAQRIEAALARLLPMVPYYSIEAWLYQNTDELRVACESRSAEKNVVDQCHARCDEWAADRSLLDEVVMVKQSVCVKDTANDRLAETMSNAVFNEVLAANQSLAATRDRWLQSESLRANLEAIRSR